MNTQKHSIETEQIVLETLMHFADHTNIRVQKVMLKLYPDCFFHSDNRQIYGLIRECFDKKTPFHFVDILTLVHPSNPTLHESLSWLIENYTNLHAGESNFEHYAERLVVLATLRKQLGESKAMIEEVEKSTSLEDSQEIMSRHLNHLSTLVFRKSNAGISTEELSDLFYKGALTEDLKLETTCQQLNSHLRGGITSKSLITIAAGAGVGKTGFSIFLLDAIARNQPGTQSLFFSLEMESKHIWMRHIGICGNLLFDSMDDDSRLKAVSRSLEVPLKIYDTASCPLAADIDFILTTARLQAMEKPISVIVVDYLGLVENKGRFERNDLKQADITSKLARLALELNCIVIALSQINRGATQRAKDDQCPWPQDAADSSGSHRSSTLWLGVDRPELYQDDPSYRNQFVIKCRKNRFGNTFELILAFNDATFAEVPSGWFKKPMNQIRNAEKALFSTHSNDFYDR